MMVSDFERRLRNAEATDGAALGIWTDHGFPPDRLRSVRLVFARLGGNPFDDPSRADAGTAIKVALAELRGAVAAVGWDAGVAVWAAMRPETEAAVLEQAAYFAALDERTAA